jgi:hypothetical protein
MVGSKIKIVKNGEIKIISEIEIIDGVDIFYTESGESFTEKQFVYCETSVFSVSESQKVTEFVLYSKNNKIAFNNLFSETAKYLPQKKSNKKQTKTIKLFGWTITFSKSK